MKVIIAGSRTIKVDSAEIHALMAHFKLQPSEIVSGTANGVDKSGEAYAWDAGIKLIQFPADWDRFGKSAGHKRNAQMAEYADVLLLIWDGQSKGSAGMKSIMTRLGKPVFEALTKPE